MTDDIRQKIKQLMQERNMSQQGLADDIGSERQYVWDILSGKRGNITKRWQQILDVFDLELCVRPKVTKP